MRTKFSVVYAVTRPVAGEKISIGIIVLGAGGEKSSFTYSRKKIEIARSLMTHEEGEFMVNAVNSFEANVIQNSSAHEVERKLSYLSRYTNNVLEIQPVQELDIEFKETDKNWLYKKYVEVR